MARDRTKWREQLPKVCSRLLWRPSLTVLRVLRTCQFLDSFVQAVQNVPRGASSVAFYVETEAKIQVGRTQMRNPSILERLTRARFGAAGGAFGEARREGVRGRVYGGFCAW